MRSRNVYSFLREDGKHAEQKLNNDQGNKNIGESFNPSGELFLFQQLDR